MFGKSSVLPCFETGSDDGSDAVSVRLEFPWPQTLLKSNGTNPEMKGSALSSDAGGFKIEDGCAVENKSSSPDGSCGARSL